MKYFIRIIFEVNVSAHHCKFQDMEKIYMAKFDPLRPVQCLHLPTKRHCSKTFQIYDMVNLFKLVSRSIHNFEMVVYQGVNHYLITPIKMLTRIPWIVLKVLCTLCKFEKKHMNQECNFFLFSIKSKNCFCIIKNSICNFFNSPSLNTQSCIRRWSTFM